MIRHQVAVFFRPLIEAWFWLVVLVCAVLGLCVAEALGAKPPQITTRPPQVTITEPADVWGDLPPYDAPAGQEWKRYAGEPWRLYPVETAAPAVAAPRPFSQAVATTRDTTVPSAAGPSTSFPGTIPTAPIRTLVPAAGRRGVTNCPT